MSDYDGIAIGGGSPGEHCAGALAGGGLRVALVERDTIQPFPTCSEIYVAALGALHDQARDPIGTGTR